jgi:hypothetical protein
MTRRRVKTGHLPNSRDPSADWKISGERTHFGKFMTGVTRKNPPDELTCMDDVQLYRVHVYRNHPHGVSEYIEGY